MNKNILWGVGFASVMAVGVTARTLPQDPAQTQPPPQTQPQTHPKSSATMDGQKVTVQGCLGRDYLYPPTSTGATTTGGAPNAAPTPFVLTQVEGIKDDQDKEKDKNKDKSLELHVVAAPTAKVDLDAQVDHKVELVGMMSTTDLNAARAKNKDMTTTSGELKTPLMFKATSVKSIADKCQ